MKLRFWDKEWKAPTASSAVVLHGDLTAARDLTTVQCEDVWARRAQRAKHRIAMADIDEHATAADRARRARNRDAAQ